MPLPSNWVMLSLFIPCLLLLQIFLFLILLLLFQSPSLKISYYSNHLPLTAGKSTRLFKLLSFSLGRVFVLDHSIDCLESCDYLWSNQLWVEQSDYVKTVYQIWCGNHTERARKWELLKEWNDFASNPSLNSLEY